MKLASMPLDLHDRIMDEVVAGNYWGEGGAISLVRQISPTVNVREAMTLASVYYSAATRAKADRQLNRWYRRPYLWFQAFCRYRDCLTMAKEYSDVMENKVSNTNYATPEQLQVRAMILFECGVVKEAKFLVIVALDKVPMNANTEALLHILFAKIYWKEGEDRSARYQYTLARNLINILHNSTRIRVYRAVAEYSIHCGDMSTARAQVVLAHDLAREHGMRDQLVKIQPLLCRLSIKP